MESQRSAASVVVVGDRAGVIEWTSAGWRELIGLSDSESDSKPIAALLDRFAVDPSVVEYVSRSFLAGEVCQVEFPFEDPGGCKRWLQVQVNPARDSDGDVTRFVAVAGDITQRVGARSLAVEECDLSELVRHSAAKPQPAPLR